MYYACIAMPTCQRCAPLILFWHRPTYNLLPCSCLTWVFFVDSHWWVQLCVQCSTKTILFQQIINHALQCQHDVDVHLFWPWPRYSLLPRSCLTWILFVDSHWSCWWVQLCVQRPAKVMYFKQIIMHALQCQHDLDVYLLFCFDLDLHITCSRGRV